MKTKKIIFSQSPLFDFQLGKILRGKLDKVRNAIRGVNMENCERAPSPTSLFIRSQGVGWWPLLVFLAGD
jgi:hypothetical protein